MGYRRVIAPRGGSPPRKCNDRRDNFNASTRPLRMHWILVSNLLGWFHGYASAFTLHTSPTVAREQPDYEYVTDRLTWHSAGRLCSRRMGALATASDAAEKQALTAFLKSQNVSQPVWVASKDPPESRVPEFGQLSNVKKFPSMGSVTVCLQLRFADSASGFSTIISYSVPSNVNELQIRASLDAGRPGHVQLALWVHGNNGTYRDAFIHDDSWHSLCVSWSQNGGRWEMFADGHQVGEGDGLHVGNALGADGVFIIGQDKANESFSGSIRQLHIWERVLSATEVLSMETQYSCQDYSSGVVTLDPSLLANPNLSVKAVQTSQVDCCVTFDPGSVSRGFDKCDAHRGAVCELKKDGADIPNRHFPKTPIFSTLSRDPLAKPVMEEMSVNSTWSRDLRSADLLTQALLRAVEREGAGVLTPTDVTFLCQMVDLDRAPLGSSPEAPGAGTMVSVATNYLKLASMVLEPQTASWWSGPSEDGVRLGPFTVVESVDRLTRVLADSLFHEGRAFRLSTNNIDVRVERLRLSQGSCRHVFKPSALSSHRSSLEELLVPDTELRRLHMLGHEEVMFIHTYYGRLNEIMSAAEQQPSPPDDPKNDQSVLPGHLTTAVISATVRDPVKAQTIPVAVQYTLTTPHVAEYSQRVTPVCVFWNYTLLREHAPLWSSKDCRVTYEGSDVTSCSCSHTTNFAILMNYMESKWSDEDEAILTKLTFIGSGASLCALVVTLMLFTVLDIPRSDRTSIHKNLFVALICAQVVLLCSGSALHHKVACTVVAALLHLCFMAAFSWMLVEGLLLWSKVVAVNLSEDRHMKYYYLIGWGLPALIVTITLASSRGRYSADGHCWLSVQNGVIWGFAGPVIFIILVNIMVLTRVVVITISTAKRRSIMLVMGTSTVEQAYEQIRAAVKAVLVLLPILGLTWLCGVLVPFSIAMAYVFVLLNSLQGLFIFLIYGVYNTEVRSTVNRIRERRKALNFSNGASFRPSSSGTSSRPSGHNPPQDHEGGEKAKGEEGKEADPTSTPVSTRQEQEHPALKMAALPVRCSLHLNRA
ncbi:adhesion G-protein coupled receptor D2 isoform X1 [Gadus macrocephalus]|uniref:adhesion G-protein coupled receptor D2 isoform X1 n=1 Tax=Gadus macrocephalus TaxID=80720 RepID=UPI0028CB5EA6|nr:adhesion G-protein coupled receptor D2 isoform X1 [Gadus macrocephalus]